jgi:hypothetical protein
MSADNGVVLRQKANGNYVLHHYFASDDEYPPVEVGGEEFSTIEAAVRKHQQNEQGDYPTEYNLTIALPEDSTIVLLGDLKPGDYFQYGGSQHQLLMIAGSYSVYCRKPASDKLYIYSADAKVQKVDVFTNRVIPNAT